jgi:feruloyl esterase
MNRVLAVAAILLGATSFMARSQETQNNSATQGTGALAALQNLKIVAGTITSVEHDTAPVPGKPGHPPIDLPPRTLLELVLNPAKGSNINVQICLPDPVKWKGRLLGLGNGGAAGHIAETFFYGALGGGYAVVTTDMGTAEGPRGGVGNVSRRFLPPAAE